MGRNPKKAVLAGAALDKLLERHMFEAVKRATKPFELGNYKVKQESQGACVKSLARLGPLLTDLYKCVGKGEIIKASCIKHGLLRPLAKHPQAHGLRLRPSARCRGGDNCTSAGCDQVSGSWGMRVGL